MVVEVGTLNDICFLFECRNKQKINRMINKKSYVYENNMQVEKKNNK